MRFRLIVTWTWFFLVLFSYYVLKPVRDALATETRLFGPLYLAFGYVLAKLGYQRRSYREVRSETRGRAAAGSGGGASAAAPPRPRPAPTKRTGGGSTRPGGRRR